MRKKLFVILMAAVLAIAASVAIYAAVEGFGNEVAVEVEAELSCCVVIDALVAPLGDTINGGSLPGCGNGGCGMPAIRCVSDCGGANSCC